MDAQIERKSENTPAKHGCVSCTSVAARVVKCGKYFHHLKDRFSYSIDCIDSVTVTESIQSMVIGTFCRVYYLVSSATYKLLFPDSGSFSTVCQCQCVIQMCSLVKHKCGC